VNNESIRVNENDSGLSESGIILTVRHTFGKESDIVVGFPGLPNENRRVATGDAVLYETPSSGTYEVRVISQNSGSVVFLVTRISPRLGISGAFVTTDPNNSPFTADELSNISISIQNVKNELNSQIAILPEQVALIHKKLDEIEVAATRLGRKDWINYVTGAITSTCASAAFAPDVTKSVFVTINKAFSWLFSNALQFLT
jgi:hypothetical protein